MIIINTKAKKYSFSSVDTKLTSVDKTTGFLIRLTLYVKEAVSKSTASLKFIAGSCCENQEMPEIHLCLQTDTFVQTIPVESFEYFRLNLLYLLLTLINQ